MIYCILAIAAFAVQNIGCKEFGARFPNRLYAQSVMLTVSTAIIAAIMAALGGANALTTEGYLIAFSFGVFFVMTIACMTVAMNSGHLGITVLIQNASLLVPVTFGMIVWKEPMTLLKGIGIALILVLLVLSAFGSGGTASANGSSRRKWMIYTALCFIGNSFLSILQSAMSKASATTDSITFTFWTGLFSAVTALAVAIYCKLRGQSCKVSGIERKNGPFAMVLCFLAIGIGTAGGNSCTISALNTMTSVVLFPIRMGGLVLLMWVLGILIYKDKITRTGLAMLAAGLLGITLLNI